LTAFVRRLAASGSAVTRAGAVVLVFDVAGCCAATERESDSEQTAAAKGRRVRIM
jgi:hypothetical protein